MSPTQTEFSPTPATITLDLVRHNFQHWRDSRVKRGKVPAELMEQAFSLVGHYPITKITKGLGLDFSQFRAQCIERRLIQPRVKKVTSEKLKVKQTKSRVTFVEVNTVPQTSALPLQDGSIQMVLHRTDGVRLEIALSQTGTAATLMTQFLRG